MNISVTAPIESAIHRTKVVLFENFDITKWFTLGFCAWLANMGEAGGGGGNNASIDQHSTSQGVEWVEENTALFLLILCGIALVSLLVLALMSWLRSRGVFMFLDGIVHNRGAVKEPWGRFKERGNRLFVANLAIGVAGMFAIFAPIAIGLAIAWSDLRVDRFEEAAVTGLIIASVGVIIPLFLLMLVSWLLRNFVAPTMYLHDESVMDAWRRVKTEVISDNLGTICLYLLMRILLAMVTGTIGCLAVCLTFCLVAIPYIGTVILLPLFVFERSYGLYFLEQFGDRWRFFPTVVSDPDPEPENWSAA